jgi:MFS family permease
MASHVDGNLNRGSNQMLNRLRSTYRELPPSFWVLTLASFIDRLGGTMIFPFFALYITHKFDVGMTEAGGLFAIFSVTGFIGGIFGGAITDRFGRRRVVLFGLVISALSSVLMGLVDTLSALYTLAFFVGFLSEIGGPARQAMVADLLPENKHAEGFGILRVSANLAWILGPMIGGILVAKSYLLVFVLDAISSLITAGIFYRFVPETKPETAKEKHQETILETLVGYRFVVADRVYMTFLITSMFMMLAYLQLYSTLSVYLRDVHGVPAQGYGFLMSMNATAVVIFQFWVIRQTKRYAPMLMMALGSALYMVGFVMYGMVATFSLFAVAMLIITIGEMIVVPVGQAIVARIAPEAMRGRYMASFGLSWTIPSAVGPWAAGLIMDNYDPNWVWYAAGIVSALSVVGFYILYLRVKESFSPQGVVMDRPGG